MLRSREEFSSFLDLQDKQLGGKWQVQGHSWLLHFVYNDPSCVTFQKTDFKYSVPQTNHMLYRVPVFYLENMMTTFP